jgi:phage terminase small subunit
MVGKDLTAARKLTQRQTALVDVMVAEGLNTSQAAKAAGYADGKAGYVTAAKTLKLPHVQQYMMQRIAEQLGTNAAFAAAKVMKLATGAKSEYVQLEASKDILDRAGFKPIDRAQVQVAGDIRVQIDLG